MRMFNTLNLNI